MKGSLSVRFNDLEILTSFSDLIQCIFLYAWLKLLRILS